MFPIVGFLTCQILGIIGFQIEIKILNNLRRCHLQFFFKLIFVSKNWPNDYKVGCKYLFNLLKFIGIDANLEKELEQFERTFEKDEVMNL